MDDIIMIIKFRETDGKSVENKRINYISKELKKRWNVLDSPILVNSPQGNHKYPKLFIYLKNIIKIIKNIKHVTKIAKRKPLLICSGGPFYPFLILICFYIFYGYKAILDFRDPFYMPDGDGRIYRNNLFKTRILQFIQYLFITGSNKITVTTEKIKSKMISIHGKKVSKKITVIQNGYDDTVKKPHHVILPKNQIVLCILGKFAYYSASDAMTLFNYIQKLNHLKIKLLQICEDDKMSSILQSYNGIEYELIPGLELEEAYKKIINAHACIVNGRDYIINSKVYDYIYLNKPVLGIYSKKTETCRFFSNFQGFFFIDSFNAFSSAINTINSPKPAFLYPPETDISKYSRKYQTKKFINIVQKILK